MCFSQIRAAFFLYFPLMIVLLASVSVADVKAQPPYKLYINKEQSETNVIQFENALNATVTHTAEGMELSIPGVEVDLRCKPASCILYFSESNASPGDDGNADCDSVWQSNCDNSTDGPTDPETPPSGGSGGCTNTTVITCSGLAYGSGGANSNNITTNKDVPIGKVLVSEMVMAAGSFFGTVDFVPDSGEQPSGVQIRSWISSTPNGAPLAGTSCSNVTGFERTTWWDTSNELGYACQLAATAGSYFWNLAACDGPDTDRTCAQGNPASLPVGLKLSGNSAPR